MFSRRAAAPNNPNAPQVHALPRPVTIAFVPVQPSAQAVCTPSRLAVFAFNFAKILFAISWVGSGLYVLSDTWHSGQSTGFHSFSAADAWISLFVLLSVTSGGAAMVANSVLAACCQLDAEYSQQVILEVECGLSGSLALFGGSVIWARAPTSAYASTMIYQWAIASFALSCFLFLYTLAPLLDVLRRHGTLYKKTWVSASNREPAHRPIGLDKSCDYDDSYPPTRGSGLHVREEQDEALYADSWADDSKSSSSSDSEDASFFRAFGSSRPPAAEQYKESRESAAGQGREQGQGVLGAVTQPLAWVGGAVFGGPSARPGGLIGSIGVQSVQALPAPPVVNPRPPTISGVPVFSGVAGATQRLSERSRGFTTPSLGAADL